MTRPIKFRVYDKESNKFLGEDKDHKLKVTFCNKDDTAEVVNIYPVYIPIISTFGNDEYCGTLGGEPVTQEMISLQMFIPDSYEVEKGNNSRFEIMQFTGLHDKNGIEIYEGDILKYTFIFMEEEPDISLGVVEYQNGCFFMEDEGLCNFCISPNSWIDAIEIIGNIYENPELWEK
jgi:hypothetical protein